MKILIQASDSDAVVEMKRSSNRTWRKASVVKQGDVLTCTLHDAYQLRVRRWRPRRHANP